ncbi:hypothetical protein BJ165DRAFT_1459603 [Panaeolus papilionaceus]|nr:hypothetical protein BJ165DRAFT_1459603 [Panaeolus papilionaceus]
MKPESTEKLDSLDQGGPKTASVTGTEQGNVSTTTSYSASSDQQPTHTPLNPSIPPISTIYPSWSSVLPLFVKGLLFPPIAGQYRRLYHKHHITAYLTNSIRYAFASLATTHSNHPSLPFYKLRLAQDLKSRYRLSRQASDLMLALWLQRTAINALPATHEDMDLHRQHLCESITLRYERYSDGSDLDLLLELQKAALADLPPGSSQSQWWNVSKAATYQLRYTKTMNLKDLELQIDSCIAAMDYVDLNDPDTLLQRASVLASAYLSRFEHLRSMDDLILALFWGHRSIQDRSSTSTVNYGIRLHTLSTVYDARYLFIGLASDSDKALELMKQAIQIIPSSNSASLSARHNLGIAYLNRGQASRSQQDLDMAIEWFSSVIGRFPKTSPDGAICAGNLAIAYLSRYNLHHSRLEDLESAVDLAMRCVQGLGDSNPKSAVFQEKLSNALFNRYSRHRNKKDLDAAIHWVNSALRLTQRNSKRWLQYQNLLGCLYLALYQHTDITAHLDEALTLQMEVVASASPDDDSTAEYYSDLASVYSALYVRRGGMENRDAIIRWHEEAVQVSKPGNRRLKAYKHSLGLEYYNRYNRLRGEEDLDKALKNISEALALSPPDDPMRVSYYGTLAAVYSERHSLSHSAEDEKETLSNYRKASQAPGSNPSYLWDKVDRWARFAELREHAEDCIDAYSTAFKILPELFWLGSDIKSRHEALIAFRINAATSKAVAGCIRFHRLSLAIEFLEQSLAMTFQQLLGLQSDLGDLADKFPAYASMLESLSTKIRGLTLAGTTSPQHMTDSLTGSNEQSKLVIERNTLLEKIRELPGFESFLLPTRFEKLGTAADQGPVIMLNTNQRRHYCDALILLPGGSIAHIVLHNVTVDDVVKQAGALKKALKAYGIQTRGVDSEDDLSRAGRVRTAPKPNKDAAFQPLLDWLWSHVVSPVFEALKAVSTSSSRIAQT